MPESASILVLTYGTRGDVEPFVALACGLVRRGNKVTICTAERFGDWVKGFGLAFAPMSNASLDVIDTPDGKAMIDGSSGLLRRVTAGIRLARGAGTINEAMSRDAWAAVQSTRPDLIVYHPKVLAAPHIGEALGIPVVMGLLQPMIVPTSNFPPVGLPRLTVPGYNRFGYSLVRLSYSAFRKSMNRVRTGLLGLKPVRSGREVLLPGGVGPIKILHAISPAVIPRPADWPPEAIMTGYWYLPPGENYEPPAKLSRFLDAGPAPVYVGFGSMTVEEPASLLRIITDALRGAGVRGVVASGWAGFDCIDIDDVITVPAVPHEWLFPRMTAVVHHGGAGTLAQGFRAGVPCVICPFFGDQPGWADRSFALGVGAQPVPRRKLSAERLAHSIRSAVNDQSLRHNAKALAQVLRKEDGVALAATEIEKSLHS